MGHRVYEVSDKAAVLVALRINEGNVTRTARETGVPEGTVRTWKQGWEKYGVPEELLTQSKEQATEFVDDLVRIRGKAAKLLENTLHEAKPSQLAVIIGITDDKIRLAAGLATSRSETVHALPAPEKMREMFTSMIRGAISAQSQREEDIIEADFEPAPEALEAAKTKE